MTPQTRGFRALVTIKNPNPRRLAVWRGAVLQDTLKTHDQLITPLTEDLRLTYAGRSDKAKAMVVMSVEDEDGPGEPWVQEVGAAPVAPDPDKAYVKGVDAAAANL